MQPCLIFIANLHMLLLAMAIAPGLAICIYIFYKDVHDREPALNLVMSFIWGMLVTLPAWMLEFFTTDLADRSVPGIIFYSFILIGLAEEGCKFLALRYYSFTRRSFDEPLDGIVYSIMVSMGFATLENIGYAYQFGMNTAWLRIITAVPAHAAFGVIMGYYVGKARFDPTNRKLLLLRGLLAAVFVHGLYDSLLFLNQAPWTYRYISESVSSLLFFIGALATLIVSVVLSLRLVRLHRATSYRLHRSKPVLTIKHASSRDIDEIRALALHIWPATYRSILSPQQVKYMMEKMYSFRALQEQMDQGQRFILVYNNAIPIGFASYGPVAKEIFKLHKLYLVKTQQGKGSGRFVIEQVIADISPGGAKALQLNVNRYNPARGFYEKMGFRVIRTEDIDIGEGFFMNDYIMEKELESLPVPG